MASERAKQVGERIRQRRLELELTQDEVASLMGAATVSGNVVSRWERGRNRPSSQYIADLAKALHTEQSWILFGRNAETNGHQDTDGLAERLERIERHLERLVFLEDISQAVTSLVDVLASRPSSEIEDAVSETLEAIGADPAPRRSGGEDATPGVPARRARRARS